MKTSLRKNATARCCKNVRTRCLQQG